MLYETKAKVHRLASTGEDKEVREHFIMNAESFAEAELRTLTEYSNVGEDADVFAIFRSNVYEIVNDKEEDKPYFLATVTDIVIDENNGNEKEMKYQMLVCAKDVTEATAKMSDVLAQGYDMRLDMLKRTKMTDYLK